MKKYILLSPEQFAKFQTQTSLELEEYKKRVAELEQRLASLTIPEATPARNRPESAIKNHFEKYALYQPALKSYLKYREARTLDERDGDVSAPQLLVPNEVNTTIKNDQNKFTKTELKGEEEEVQNKADERSLDEQFFKQELLTPTSITTSKTPAAFLYDTVSQPGHVLRKASPFEELEKWQRNELAARSKRDRLGRPVAPPHAYSTRRRRAGAREFADGAADTPRRAGGSPSPPRMLGTGADGGEKRRRGRPPHAPARQLEWFSL